MKELRGVRVVRSHLNRVLEMTRAQNIVGGTSGTGSPWILHPASLMIVKRKPTIQTLALVAVHGGVEWLLMTVIISRFNHFHMIFTLKAQIKELWH